MDSDAEVVGDEYTDRSMDEAPTGRSMGDSSRLGNGHQMTSESADMDAIYATAQAQEDEEDENQEEEVDQTEGDPEQKTGPYLSAVKEEGQGRRRYPKMKPMPGNNAITIRPSTTNRVPALRYDKKTLSRNERRSRPHTVSAIRDTVMSRPTGQQEGGEGGKGLSEDESEDANNRTFLSDIMDFGDQSIDIFADDGWDTDLEEEEEKVTPSYDGTLQGIYKESCKNNNVIPASYFLRHLTDSELRMRHHGLGGRSMRPLAIALVSNTTITKLDLSDNYLGQDGGKAVCEMLKENCYMTEIILNENKLGLDFANRFQDVLRQNVTLSHVSLAGNDFDDECALPLSEGIMNTTRIEYLDLSRNLFAERGGQYLGPAISENSSIKNLNLSWNCIRKKGAVAVGKGLKTNVLMQKIDLSWNGFGTDGAKAIGDALKGNASLEELDLTNNRITPEGAVVIGKGLTANETLKVLKIGKNPIQSAGCYGVCSGILRNPNSVMQKVEFTDVKVNSDFLELLPKVYEAFPDLKVTHSGTVPPKKPKARAHPMVKLKMYIERNKLRLVDFFNKLDTDQSMSVSREEFAEGIREAGIPLNEDEIEKLIEELDKDGDGEINYSELVVGHQDFADKQKKINPITTTGLGFGSSK